MTAKLPFRFWILVAAFAAISDPAFAATITPVQPGADTYRLQQSAGCYVTLTCTTTLVPPGVVNLGAANTTSTTGLRAALNAEFPGYTYAYGGNLNVTYHINTYQAFNTGTNGGANFNLDITNLGAAPAGSTWHWVQWINDNWNFTGYDPAAGAPKGIGNHENTIDGTYPTGGFSSPFYDVFPPGNPNNGLTSPGHFQDGSQRGEPTPAVPVITWDAELFLVSSMLDPNDNTKTQITFYNGIEWGWETTLSPLPAAWTMMALGLGIGGLFMRRRRTLSVAAA